VFRDWPYLYDGSEEYERSYLASFAATADALIVVARDGNRIVGAATAAPLTGHTSEFGPLFAARGIDPAQVFYCGESVLLASYRGHGIGHAFFDHREDHARACRTGGRPFEHIAFCGIVQPPGDARMPPDYRPLDAFWRKRGYAPVDGLTGNYRWREIGHVEETDHVMQFWMKALRS
jgi:GNAT superfamily N-acetyltransferase